MRRAFTAIELLVIILVVTVLVAGASVFIGEYIKTAKWISARQTVQVLNEAVNEYRTMGGMNLGHSLEGPAGATRNSDGMTRAVITALRNGFPRFGKHLSFVRPDMVFDIATIASTGQGSNFQFYVDAGKINRSAAPSATVRPEVSVASARMDRGGDAPILSATLQIPKGDLLDITNGIFVVNGVSYSAAVFNGTAVMRSADAARWEEDAALLPVGSYDITFITTVASGGHFFYLSASATVADGLRVQLSTVELPPEGLLWSLQSDTNITQSGSKLLQWQTTDGLLAFVPALRSASPTVDTSPSLNGIPSVYFTRDLCVSSTVPNLPVGNAPRSFAALALCTTGNTDRTNCNIWSYGEVGVGKSIGLAPRINWASNWGIALYGQNDGQSGVSSISSTPQLLILTYDGATVRLYNGSSLITSVDAELNTSQTVFSLGGWNAISYLDGSVNGHELGNGRIWEVDAWDVVLSADEIAQVVDHINSKYGLDIP